MCILGGMKLPKMPEMPPPAPKAPIKMTKKIRPTPIARSRMAGSGFQGSLSQLRIPLNLPQ